MIIIGRNGKMIQLRPTDARRMNHVYGINAVFATTPIKRQRHHPMPREENQNVD